MSLHVPILSLLLCPLFVTVPFVLLLVPFLPQSDLSLLCHTVLHRCHSVAGMSQHYQHIKFGRVAKILQHFAISRATYGVLHGAGI